MKKGFTLVELSIVIVIIGILMGMTVKGKSLIDSARIKSDMATINKMRTAVAAYAADNNAIFPDNFSETTLQTGNYITANDRNLKLGETPVAVSRIMITNGDLTANPPTGGRFSVAATTDSSNDIGVQFGTQASDIILGCMIDESIDDGISGLGDVRVLGSATTAIGKTVPQTQAQCKAATDNTQYAVLVF